MTVTFDDHMLIAGGLLLLIAWLLTQHPCPDCPLAAARPTGRVREGEHERAHEGSERPAPPIGLVDRRAGVAEGA